MESNIQETTVEYSHERPNLQNYEHTFSFNQWLSEDQCPFQLTLCRQYEIDEEDLELEGFLATPEPA